MKVKDAMVKNIISVGPQDSLTIALNKMQQNGINQVPVIEGSRYDGMIVLKDVVEKNIDPARSKCANFAIKTPSVKSSDDIGDAVKTMLNSGLKAIPVVDDYVVGIISETDVIKFAPKISREIADVPVMNIATDVEFVGKSDSVAKVRKIMAYKNVSRVPVVDAGKVIGVVGTLDIIKLMEGRKELPARGGRTQERGAKEKLGIESTPVSNFMHQPSVVSSGSKLGNILPSLVKNEEAFVLDNGIKIITPKDVLELITSSSPGKQVYVDVIGMRNEGPQLTAKVDKALNDFVQKMGRTIENIQYVFLHVDKYDKGGKKPLYSIRARFGTPIGMFVARAEDRDPITAVQRVFDDMEKEIDKKTGRARAARKKSRILKKR